MLKKPIPITFNLDSHNSVQSVCAVIHIDDKNTETLDLSLMQGGEHITVSPNSTVTARFVRVKDKILISDNVPCTVQKNGNIHIPIDNAAAHMLVGEIKIEVNIVDENDVLTMQFPLVIRVNNTILADAEISPESEGTIPELLEEARKAAEDAAQAAKAATEEISTKQDKLTAGQNITITEENVISASSGSNDYTELENKPSINNVTLSGNKSSDDLSLQGKLTAGNNITIEDNVISAEGADVSGKADKSYVDTELAKKADKTEIPTKISAFTNDVGYLTQHQSLSDYYTKYFIDQTFVDYEQFNSELDSFDDKLTQKQDISKMKLSVSDSDKTGEHSGEYYPSVPAMLNYIEGKGYLTQHQDISGKENTSNKKTSIDSQSQTGDSDTNYPTVGAVRDFVNFVKSDLEDYVDEEIDNIPKTYTKSEVDSLVDRKAKSAYDIAVDNGYTGTQQEWIASLHAASPTVLPLSVYPNEASAVEYMNSQLDKSVVYVWNNKVYTYCTYSVQGLSGACLYWYRNSASSGLVPAENRSTLIIPVSSFEAPLTIDYTGFALSINPYIYGGTTPTVLNKTLISNDGYVGRTDPIDITATQLQGCTYVAMAIATNQKPADFNITVNGSPITMKVITSPSEIDSAMDSGSITVTGYVDSGVEYAYPIDGTSGAAYLKTRSTYLPPVPRAYCESKASYEAGSHYLSKYSYSVMTSMFSAVAAAHTDYVTETNLGKDASNTYDIKKYVLNAASSLESGYTSALTNHKPVMIITAGLHGVEPDAVHTVYHFMDDLCNHYMESEELLYLHNNVKFVIVPISNPWGYVNQSYHNSNDVDINKNFEYGYRNNGSANTGTAAYSEAETQILKGVFDEYPEAVFHLECHGKYGEDTAFNKTIWFSLMSSLSSELIEISADNLNSKTGMRLKELGYNTGNSTGGYITYYGLNGRPKDYTGSKYGILSATMEGTGKIYGTSGYSVDTQKINTEALENFLLTVLSGFENGL